MASRPPGMAIKEIISRNSDLLIRFLHHALQDQSQSVFQQLPLLSTPIWDLTTRPAIPRHRIQQHLECWQITAYAHRVSRAPVSRSARNQRMILIAALGFIASWSAWHYYHSFDELNSATPLDPSFPHRLWFLSATALISSPGVVTVYMFGDRPATAITDLVTIVLNGMFWGGVGIAILRLVWHFRDRSSGRTLTRAERVESAVEILGLVLTAACFASYYFKSEFCAPIIILSLGLAAMFIVLAASIALFFFLRGLVYRMFPATRPHA